MRTIEELLGPLSTVDLADLCDHLGAPVGGVLTPTSDAAARRVFIAALKMLGDFARQEAGLPVLGD